MAFITFGNEEPASKERERMSPIAKLLTGVVLAGGAVAALRGKAARGGQRVTFSDEWNVEERTKRLPRESMQEVVFGRRR